MVQGDTSQKKNTAPFRKHLLLPAEHGTWFWFLVPFFTGMGVAREINTAVFLTFIGAFAAFLVRQPVTALLQIRRGRGRKSDFSPARRLAVALSLIALASLLGLVALDNSALLWLLLPLLPLAIVYLVVARQRRAAIRTFGMEIAGAVGLALAAPAAHIAAAGQATIGTWAVWGFMAAQNALGAHYVHLRLADTHQRPSRRTPLVWSHGFAFLAILAFGIQNIFPILTAVPFAFFLARALWTAARPRPVLNIKRFGLTEVALEILSAMTIIFAYRTT